MSLPAELGLPKHFEAKQTRCVYGTRSAEVIWEQRHGDALENIGFTSGVQNPCLFYHQERDISIAVHGMTLQPWAQTWILIGIPLD